MGRNDRQGDAGKRTGESKRRSNRQGNGNGIVKNDRQGNERKLRQKQQERKWKTGMGRNDRQGNGGKQGKERQVRERMKCKGKNYRQGNGGKAKEGAKGKGMEEWHGKKRQAR